jgi:hypothetical protein
MKTGATAISSDMLFGEDQAKDKGRHSTPASTASFSERF